MVKIEDVRYIAIVKNSLRFVSGFTEDDETLEEILRLAKARIRLKVSSRYDDLIEDWLETDKLYSPLYQKAVVSQVIWDYQNKFGANLKFNQFESLSEFNRTVDLLIKDLQKGVNRIRREGVFNGGDEDGFK